MQGIASGVIALIGFGEAIRRLGAGGAALFPSLVPAAAVLIGIPVTQELPAPLQAAGADAWRPSGPHRGAASPGVSRCPGVVPFLRPAQVVQRPPLAPHVAALLVEAVGAGEPAYRSRAPDANCAPGARVCDSATSINCMPPAPGHAAPDAHRPGRSPKRPVIRSGRVATMPDHDPASPTRRPTGVAVVRWRGRGSSGASARAHTGPRPGSPTSIVRSAR